MADFTPALGFRLLTPAYELVIGLLTREAVRRSRLIRLIAPAPGGRIRHVEETHGIPTLTGSISIHRATGG